jgi:indole-3-glycerol phosphate synthase
MGNILDQIVAHKRTEVAADREALPLAIIQREISKLPPTRSLSKVLRKPGEVALLAEIKKASPSKGVIRADFDAVEIAKIYTQAGAAAISVLTDHKFFQGSPDYLRQVREVTNLPLLRKEFIIDAYQIYQARLLGADAILLIAGLLETPQLVRFQELAGELGLECLVEVHTEAELAKARAIGAKLIGINNRDLTVFKTDLHTTIRLKSLITDPEVIVVSESGINTRADVLLLAQHGVDAMLVGEALMRQGDIAAQLAYLLKDQPAAKVVG